MFNKLLLQCFNSQPPEGGWAHEFSGGSHSGRFNSQPPEGGWGAWFARQRVLTAFQLTAARRRLVPPLKPLARKACITLFR